MTDMPCQRLGSAWQKACSVRSGRLTKRSVTEKTTPDVEPQRARCVRHLRDGVAGEAQAHIILGQEHAPGGFGDLCLVRGDPQHFRRGEAGHGEIAGALFEIGNAALELGAFGERAAVVPQDRGPQRLVCRVEQGRAVHLAGKADARQRREFGGRLAADRRDSGLDAFNPVVRVLLAPEGLRARHA
jgi:hypothetical protein